MKIKAQQGFSGVVDADRGLYLPVASTNGASKKLPPGAYQIGRDPNGQFYFKSLSFTSDEVIDLPSPAFQQVVNEMEHFLKPETKAAFEAHGYIYKRSALLHGLPGTGKTCILNRISERMVEQGNVVLFSPAPHLLETAFSILNDLQPEQTTLVILEEMDRMVQQGQEENLLLLLDGQVQKNNVMYLATTNYIDRLPGRLYRPGRMSSVIEVGYPAANARKAYLDYKIGKTNGDIINLIVEKTDGFSIDEVKEVVQGVVLFGTPLEVVLKRIWELKALGVVEVNSGITSNDEYDEDDEDDNKMFTSALFKGFKP